jgi:YidC/Oxa1 family membrane protein insertase
VEKRFILFIVLSVGVMFAFMAVNFFLAPRGQNGQNGQNVAQQNGQADGEAADDGADAKADAKAPDAGKADAGEADGNADAGNADAGNTDGSTADGAGKADSGPVVDGQQPDPPEAPAPDPPKPGEQPEQAGPPEKPAQPQKPLGLPETQRATLGSLAPASKYAFLATFVSEGAALERIELSDPKYRDLEDPSGYLGHLALTPEPTGGCRVNVVGSGTPAASAKSPAGKVEGIRKGDVLLSIDGQQVDSVGDVNRLLVKTRPGQRLKLSVRRESGTPPQANSLQLVATLGHRPLEVVRPEPADHDHVQPLDLAPSQDPLSLLLTIGAYKKTGGTSKFTRLERLLSANWKLQEIENGVEFSLGPGEGLDDAVLAEIGLSGKLEIVKRFRLEPQSEADRKAGRFAGKNPYHVTIEIELRNLGDQPIKGVSYVLEGPNGLPTEGWWFYYKVSPGIFTSAGARDILYQTKSMQSYEFVTCHTVFTAAATEERRAVKFVSAQPMENRTLTYAGVDSQYFAAVLVPGTLEQRSAAFNELSLAPASIAGLPESHRSKLTNATFELVSQPLELAPGKPQSQKFVLFAGPKDRELLAAYQLSDFIYYGWFGYVSEPLVRVLHFFHWATREFSYGLAIIMLTVLVRGCMYPISRKAVRNAQMMQALAPEMKAIADKYKTDMEKRGKAQRELFAKYNYNPFGGCLLMFLQLPIFLGLYRALCVDIELRGAPLIPGLSWCSNLAAPDMLFSWAGLWDYLTAPTGWLGPYFNLLPLFTVALFAVQQKMFTPPPTDEQQKMTQNMMMWMTLFIGLMFFKVPSGLCVYFITSSLWGVLERKVFPKPKLPPGLQEKKSDASGKSAGGDKSGGNGAARQAARLKKEKGRR